MVRKVGIITRFVWGMLITLFMFGCTKERPVRFADNQGGPHLLSINEWHGKTYPVTILGELIPGNFSSTSRADINVKLNSDKELDRTKRSFSKKKNAQKKPGKESKDLNEKKNIVINNMPYVKYKTDAPYVDEESDPFRANPDPKIPKGTYQIRFEVTFDKLVIYKVAPEKYIPYQELDYSKKIKITQSGKTVELVAVPLASLPIIALRTGRTPDNDFDPTNIIREYRVDTFNQATHFRITSKAKKPFIGVLKQNVFPKEYFNGEWFYTPTIIQKKKNDETGLIIGTNIDSDFELKQVSRIKFNYQGQRLSARNINVDPDLLVKEGDIRNNTSIALGIAIEHVDFRRMRNELDNSMQEETLGRNNPLSLPEEKRKYVRLNFENLTSLFKLFDDNTFLNDPGGRLESLTVSENYFSFLVNFNVGIRVVFAFKRAHKEISKNQRRLARKLDMLKFGYFTTKREKKHDNTVSKEESAKTHFINRFYPRNGVIEYRFTKTTPTGICREAGRESIKKWNELFVKAGTGIKVNLVEGEGKDVDLGDIRYNAINCIDDKFDDGFILGVGPSVSDTYSGEIISATANIMINPIKNTIREILQNLTMYYGKATRHRLLALPECYTWTYEKSRSSLDPQVQEKLSERCKVFDLYAKESEFNFSDNYSYKFHQNLKRNKEKSESFNSGFTGSDLFEGVFADITKLVHEKCNEGDSNVVEYINELKNLNQDKNYNSVYYRTSGGSEIIESCTEKIIYPWVVFTTLHELGHNFGLRHNFAGSADGRNIISKNSFSSSIMDYLPLGYSPAQSVLDSYDEAAIRFGYNAQIPILSSNSRGYEYVKMKDPSKTISLNLERMNKKGKLYNFYFCSDAQRVKLTDDFPYCNYFDWGRTPLDIVRNKIAFLNVQSEILRWRNDNEFARAQTSKRLVSLFDVLVFNNLSKIYIYWRNKINKESSQITTINKDLFGMSEEEWSSVELDVAKRSEENKNLYMASKMIKEFLLKLSKIPDRTCLGYKILDGEIKARGEILTYLANKIGDYSIQSCSNPKVVTYFEKGGWQPHKNWPSDIGFIYKDIEFDPDEKIDKKQESKTKYDIIGLKRVFARSLQVLANSEIKWSEQLIKSNTKPRMMQEPEIRDNFESFAYSSILEGTLVTSLDGMQTMNVPVFDGMDITEHNLAGVLGRYHGALRRGREGSNGNVGTYEDRIRNFTWHVAPADAIDEITNASVESSAWTSRSEKVFYALGNGLAEKIIKKRDFLSRAGQLPLKLKMEIDPLRLKKFVQAGLVDSRWDEIMSTKISDLTIEKFKNIINEIETACKTTTLIEFKDYFPWTQWVSILQPLWFQQGIQAQMNQAPSSNKGVLPFVFQIEDQIKLKDKTLGDLYNDYEEQIERYADNPNHFSAHEFALFELIDKRKGTATNDICYYGLCAGKNE